MSRKFLQEYKTSSTVGQEKSEKQFVDADSYTLHS